MNDRPVALVQTADGGEDCLVFDWATGELTPDRAYFEQVGPGRELPIFPDSWDGGHVADEVAAGSHQGTGRICRLRASTAPGAGNQSERMITTAGKTWCLCP